MFADFDFSQFFSEIRNKKILIIGDVMIDTYLWGKVNRVSPEAPVPIVSEIVDENRLGGAANVALNVKAMGAVPILCSVIGADKKGSIFLDLLEEQNLSDVGITVDDFRITTQKTRVISGFKHLLRIDEEIENMLSRRLESAFIEMILNLMDTGGISAVIFQDYDKGVVTSGIISRVTKFALEKGIPVMADPKFRNFKNFQGVTLYKPNLKEFNKGLKLDLGKKDIEELVKSGEEFRKSQSQKLLMVTLSDKGVIILSDEGSHYVEALERKVTDVSGAGDTVISVSALCYSGGMTPGQIAIVSNIAGGLVCEKSGVVPVNMEQLKQECEALVFNKEKN